MKSISMALFVLVAAGLAGQAAASQELAKSKSCMGCHAVDRKMVGPAYKANATTTETPLQRHFQ